MAKMKFDESLVRLRDIVNSLEAGEISLDDAIKKYEEAIKLVRSLNEVLESCEAKVRILVESEDGSTTDKDFISDEA